MKALLLKDYGEKDNIIVSAIPEPEVSDGKVLVQVRAASVNPIDWKIQYGYMKDMLPPLPLVLGGDLAGVVAAVGSDVTDFKVGDEVFGQGSVMGGASGSFAEFDLTSANSIALKPKTLDFTQASAAPLTGVSAIQALYDHLELAPGQKILIHGGAGGIGSMAIQIAKHIGAYVITTVSTNDVEFAKGLGADEVIDYRNQQFETLVKDIDAVFDLVGGESNKKSYGVLKNGGKLVSMVAQIDETLAQQYGVVYTQQGTRVRTERLQKLAELIDSGIITVHVEKTFSIDEAASALAYLHDTPPKGKVVITVS